MKKTALTVALISTGVLIGMLVSKQILTAKPSYEFTNHEKWLKCLEQGNGSDAECQECDYLYNYGLDINYDLPEEINQATEKDTLIGIKKGSTIYLEFKN